jgi:hypothetical protein
MANAYQQGLQHINWKRTPTQREEIICCILLHFKKARRSRNYMEFPRLGSAVQPGARKYVDAYPMFTVSESKLLGGP